MHCVAHVKEALEGLPGLTDIEVSLDNKWATANGTASHSSIQAAIEEEGYDVVKIED